MDTATATPLNTQSEYSYMEKTFTERHGRYLTQADFEKAFILSCIRPEFEGDGASVFLAISNARMVKITKCRTTNFISTEQPTKSMPHRDDIYDPETCPIEHQMNLDARARFHEKFCNQTSEVMQ